MQADDFVRKWAPGGPAHGLGERAGAQPHFIDLCRVLGVPEPADPDSYCFERGLAKTGGSGARTDGFADVWKRGCFAWEYKAPGKSLEAALKQLMMYALPLENPPLLVVSDRQTIQVHTHFTGTPSERHVFRLEELTRPEVQQRLRALWLAPDSYKPKLSNREITEQAARTFAGSAKRLRDAGVPPQQVSHFLTQCVFCFFAEDTGLLPGRLFERLVAVSTTPEKLRAQLQKLFEAMREGGLFGVDDVPWFNGGLFAAIDVPPLAADDVATLRAASGLDWSAIDPSILGTLFERGLDPGQRAQLGAHYTDPATILRLVEPVVQRPLLAEWAEVKPRIEAALGRSRKHGDKAWRDAQAAFAGYLERLREYRVLDPACGSGNFLYLALKCLKDIEHQVNLEAEALGLQRQHDVTGPHNVLGIELNEYAAELARVTVWIGELQWRIQRGYPFKLNPVLEPLDHIECRDAILGFAESRSAPTVGTPSRSLPRQAGEGPGQRVEARWPAADAVVGNPPFVGDKKMRGELGDAYTDALRAAYKGRVPGGADLVCFWFERARSEIEAGRLQRAGLVATNSIRQRSNRTVLERVAETTRIFDVWPDEPWVNEGAAVRVSLVAFGASSQAARIAGGAARSIGADLREIDESIAAHAVRASPLAANADACFFGLSLAGPFVVPSEVARRWLALPNPNGRSNADVLSPIWNGADVTRRPDDRWVIDFGPYMAEADAAMFELPFDHVLQHVKPVRQTSNRESRARRWWIHGEARPALRAATHSLSRCIVTSETAKHRCFVWLPRGVAPEHKLVVIPRADDSTLGVLSSRPHVLWALRMGSTLEDRPVYTTSACFYPFPFPAGLAPADTAHQRTETLPEGAVIPAGLPPAVRPQAEAIARAAARLVALRDAWLNPPEWTDRVPEVVPLGMTHSPYPDRIVARPGFAGDLAKRTLTNLYNARPAWLAQAHAALDAAVAAAYGWTDWRADLPDDEILRRLLALNRERAGM